MEQVINEPEAGPGPVTDWKVMLNAAVAAYIAQEVPWWDSHTADTPERVVRAFGEYVAGYKEDPAELLRRSFSPGHYDQMVHVRNIRITSMCAHHLQPIIGVAHFAYVPNDSIVGLSKIPRFIRCLASRLQVQERLTDEIVDTFQKEVQPGGCAVFIQAYHFCMMARGAREHSAYTETCALRGGFQQGECRAEFMASLRSDEFKL